MAPMYQMGLQWNYLFKDNPENQAEMVLEEDGSLVGGFMYIKI